MFTQQKLCPCPTCLKVANFPLADPLQALFMCSAEKGSELSPPNSNLLSSIHSPKEHTQTIIPSLGQQSPGIRGPSFYIWIYSFFSFETLRNRFKLGSSGLPSEQQHLPVQTIWYQCTQITTIVLEHTWRFCLTIARKMKSCVCHCECTLTDTHAFRLQCCKPARTIQNTPRWLVLSYRSARFEYNFHFQF